MLDILVTGGLIVDGTGSQAYNMDLGIKEGKSDSILAGDPHTRLYGNYHLFIGK